MSIVCDTNKHSVFLLQYHLVMCVKNRKDLIDKKICKDLENMFIRISDKYNIDLEKYDFGEGFVHILFKAEPKSPISKFINAYKSATSRVIKNDYSYIKDNLSDNAFWSKSFLLLTTGNFSKEILNDYIKAQKD